MGSTHQLPKDMRAIVVESTEEPPAVQIVPTTEPALGTAVVRVLAVPTLKFMKDVFTSGRKIPLPHPMIPGTAAIARIVAIGPDSTKIKIGDLVFFDCVIRSRDNPTDRYLSAVPFALSEGAKILKDNFCNGTYAEYCLSPLENLIVLNEARLTGSVDAGGLGYRIEQLVFVAMMLIPFGGLKDIDLQAGETIIVAPATGPFGGYAVLCAQAMGARVIAMGRNKEILAELKSRVSYPERLETVAITGDMELDLAELKKLGRADAFFDIGPPDAYASTHIKSAILSLRHGARISMMGGYQEDIPIPYRQIMYQNLRIHGKYMYERTDVTDLFKLVELGLLDLNVCKIRGEFCLDQWNEAFDQATKNTGFAKSTLIKP